MEMHRAGVAMVLFRLLRAQSPPSVFGPGGTLFRSHLMRQVQSPFTLLEQTQFHQRAEGQAGCGGLCLRYFLLQLGCEARFLVQVEG